MNTSGRTVWWAKDSGWWRREAVVELGEEFGPAGPAVLDWLACEAKAQNDGGMVKAGYRACARGCFVDLVTVRHVVSRAVTLGALKDHQGDDRVFTARISGWQRDQERGRAAARQAAARAARDDESPVPEPDPPRLEAVTHRDTSRSVTVRHAEAPTGQDRTEELQPPQPPASGGRRRDVDRFEWEVTAFAANLLGRAPTADEAKVIAGAIRRGAKTRDAVVAEVRQWRPDLDLLPAIRPVA